MGIFAAAVVVELITVHMINGRIVQLNPQEITQVIHPETPNNGHRVLVDGVNCVIRLTDGSFVSIIETCEQVQQILEGKGQL